MASQQQVHIIGAGIAGLTLGRCLKNKGIPAILFEKGASSPRHNYGISLHSWAYQPLLKVLNMDEGTFRQRLAVDSSHDDMGHVVSTGNSKALPPPFRAHCGRLESLLREGLEIEWRHTLQDILQTESTGTVLDIKSPSQEKGKRIKSTLTVDASGVHSQIRKSLSPTSQLNILPYVVFRGTRKVEGQTFKVQYKPYMKGENIIEMRKGDVLFQIQINDGGDETRDHVDISYIYSRPARSNDALHQPGRATSQASDISEDFFAEVSRHDLEPPFEYAFDVEKMRSERVLHWLMRSLLPPLPELTRLSEMGVVMLGDSAHATPILGGNGANWAIKDGIELAESIAIPGAEGLDGYYERRYGQWQEELRTSELRLADLYKDLPSVL